MASVATAAEPVRWTDVVQRLEENPRFAEARARAQAAAAGVKATSQVPNPQFEVTGGEGRSQDGLQRRGEWSVSLTMPLDWVGTQAPRVDAARIGRGRRRGGGRRQSAARRSCSCAGSS